MKFQHVRFDIPPEMYGQPWFVFYRGQGFWDLRLGRHRWRWFW